MSISHATAVSPGLAEHIRINRSLLASAERRTLVWIAHRLPRAVTSDHLSALGLCSMLGAGIAFANIGAGLWAAVAVVACLIANWFGDSLDGTVARVRGQQRPRYGYYVDHVIDLAGTTVLMAGLASSSAMSPLAAASVLAAYLLVTAETYLATHSSGTFTMSCLGVGPTELRILLAAGALKIASDPWISLGALGTFKLFDAGGVIAAGALSLVFMTSSLKNARALYAAEPLPASEDATSRRAA
jgi:phosphatidylglycerophosphate synthase